MQKCVFRRRHDAGSYVAGDGIRRRQSVLAAGLCRIFIRMVRVPRRLTQNMALNSGITPDGKEMGRAQIFLRRKSRGSRQMCGESGVLLKPTSDRRAGRADGGAAFTGGCGELPCTINRVCVSKSCGL